jgi:hypothetical protein
MAVLLGSIRYNKLTEGTQYRQTNEGYVLIKGNRQVFIIAKSVIAGQKAKNMIANNSFDKLFKKGKKISTLGNNVSYIKL